MPPDSSAVETKESGYLSVVETQQEDPSINSDANTAAPSSSADDNSQDAKEPVSVLDAVKERLEKDKAEASSASEESGQEEPPKDTRTKDGKAEKSAKPEKEEGSEDGEDDEETPPFHEHPAWKRQIAKRQELETWVEDLRPKAERFDQMANMMSEAQLSPEEVDKGFNIMAAMKRDPQAALEAIKPYYEQLMALTGNTLPADLMERVETGEMSEEAAREFAQTRYYASSARMQAEEASRRAQESIERTERDRVEAARTAMVEAAETWETTWKSKDPDYEEKKNRVAEKLNWLTTQGGRNPQTPQEVAQLCEEALSAVNDDFRRLRPRKQPVRTLPDTSSVQANPVPKSSLEAGQLALAAARSG